MSRLTSIIYHFWKEGSFKHTKNIYWVLVLLNMCTIYYQHHHHHLCETQIAAFGIWNTKIDKKSQDENGNNNIIHHELYEVWLLFGRIQLLWCNQFKLCEYFCYCCCFEIQLKHTHSYNFSFYVIKVKKVEQIKLMPLYKTFIIYSILLRACCAPDAWFHSLTRYLTNMNHVISLNIVWTFCNKYTCKLDDLVLQVHDI